MKKLSLLLGTLGGGLAGYLFSNKALREQLSNAKDAEHAAKLLGQHLQKDGKKFAAQVQEFIESDDVQKNLKKAKIFAKQKMDEAKKELNVVMETGKKRVEKAATKGVKKARIAAKKTVRRVKTKVRKVS